MIPIHFLSVEHSKFQEKFGKEKGTRITHGLGILSGWGFFIFLFGIWFSPQPRFSIFLLPELILIIPSINYSIPLINIFFFISTHNLWGVVRNHWS